MNLSRVMNLEPT